MSNSSIESAYTPPEAELIDTEKEGHTRGFVSTSIPKLSLLFICTFGIYIVVFFYINWKRQKTKYDLEIHPALRAIFAIFFTHILFERVSSELKEGGITYTFYHKIFATLYVIITLASVLSEHLLKGLGEQLTFLISMGLTIAVLYPIYMVQKAINVLNKDKPGQDNNKFTIVNYIFIVLGSLAWLAIIAGYILPAAFISGA